MLKLFPRRSRSARPSTAAGERVYAIGDVHGRFDLLQAVLAKVAEHSNARPDPATMHIVFLGDLIDRGDASREVLQFLYDLQQRTEEVVILLGNHEEMLLKALRGFPGVLSAWMRSGGRATVRSFGLEPADADTDPRAYAARLAAAIPREWVEWLKKLPLTARSGDYLLCHAGVRPGVPLARQTSADLLWIRREFLEHESDYGAVIIHGHSVTPEVVMRANRIGIDTGAHKTGILTALYLEGEEREIISTTASAQ